MDKTQLACEKMRGPILGSLEKARSCPPGIKMGHVERKEDCTLRQEVRAPDVNICLPSCKCRGGEKNNSSNLLGK